MTERKSYLWEVEFDGKVYKDEGDISIYFFEFDRVIQ